MTIRVVRRGEETAARMQKTPLRQAMWFDLENQDRDQSHGLLAVPPISAASAETGDMPGIPPLAEATLTGHPTQRRWSAVLVGGVAIAGICLGIFLWWQAGAGADGWTGPALDETILAPSTDITQTVTALVAPQMAAVVEEVDSRFGHLEHLVAAEATAQALQSQLLRPLWEWQVQMQEIDSPYVVIELALHELPETDEPAVVRLTNLRTGQPVVAELTPATDRYRGLILLYRADVPMATAVLSVRAEDRIAFEWLNGPRPAAAHVGTIALAPAEMATDEAQEESDHETVLE